MFCGRAEGIPGNTGKPSEDQITTTSLSLSPLSIVCDDRQSEKVRAMELRHHRHRDGLTHDYSSPSLPRSKNTSAEVPEGPTAAF